METQVTLKLKEKLLREAEDLARSKGTSLSKMMEDYLHLVVTISKKEGYRSPILSEITGVLHLDVLTNYKKHLVEKYL